MPTLTPVEDPKDHLAQSPYAAPEVKEAAKRKWLYEAGPRQIKLVIEALNTLAREHNTFTELIGVIGVSEQAYSMCPMFGVSNREDVSKVQKEIAERFDYTVTRKNYQAIVDAVSQAMPALRDARPVNDKRRSPEDEDARQREQQEREREQRERRLEREQERLAAEAPRRAEIDRLELELRERYPWAQKDPKLSPQAQAAANLRRELAEAFPGIKFSVRSDSASMCSSVDYSWELGPTGDEVAAIADKYEYHRFDSIQDLASEDNSAYGEAVERVLGRAKYVSGQRSIPEPTCEQIGRLLCEAQRVEYAGDTTEHVFGQGDTRCLRDHVREILSRTTFPLHSEITGMVWKESGYDELTGEDVKQSGYHLTFSESPYADIDHSEPWAAKKAGVTVNENPAKAGIEIRFEPKPSQAILDLIHAQGHSVWRWHKKGKFWYAKANESTRAFAQSLLESKEEPNAD